MQRFGFIIYWLVFFGAFTTAWAQSPPVKPASRIEELFIWKISEELKLSVKEEKSLSTLISELNQRKADASVKMDEVVAKMAQQLDSPQEGTSKLVKEYRSALLAYNKISTDEIDKVQKLLPKEKVTKYFVVKSDLSKRIRNLMSGPERFRERNFEPGHEEKPPMGDPKIIEE